MLRNSLWRLASGGRVVRGPHFLCIGCVETQIGRRLDRHDFAAPMVNDPHFGAKSDRLLDRLSGFGYSEAMIAARRSQAEIRESNLRQIPVIRAY